MDLRSRERVSGVARAGNELGLVDIRTDGGVEPLLVAAEAEQRLSQRDAFDGAQLGIHFQQ